MITWASKRICSSELVPRAVWTVIRADKWSVWRDSNESRGFVPLLAHKHYIEHFSNFSYRFRGKLYRDNYRYRIIAQPYDIVIQFSAISPSPKSYYISPFTLNNRDYLFSLNASSTSWPKGYEVFPVPADEVEAGGDDMGWSAPSGQLLAEGHLVKVEGSVQTVLIHLKLMTNVVYLSLSWMKQPKDHSQGFWQHIYCRFSSFRSWGNTK